ncbi:transglycosylase SLT domain-containing protein [Undibacterium danionis]|uniref:Transglycosylase SLT domain-containing protein n=1 Tax=Undibacterium danionis TaxID=1812100 RepID=A0ABV6ID02_9BURK
MRWLIATFICAMCFTAMAQSIPPAAFKHKADLTRIAHAEWGLDAPIATFAAQIQQESGWNSQAVSRVGAEGMGQFMPATAKWWCSKYSISVINCQPKNPIWAMRSLAQYNLWLYKQIRAVDHCQRMAMTLSGFNGGLGWVFKDKELAFSKGLNPQIYFEQVELVNAGRSTANFKENRDYPRRILFRYEALYLTWGKGSCTSEVLR